MDRFDEFLQAAITGEYNAIRRYTKYAEIAVKEKLQNVAYLFKALATGERVHLENHKRAYGKEFSPKDEAFTEGTTLENLKASVSGETMEYEEMYPRIMKALKRGKREDEQVARLSMQWAREVEKMHAMILSKAVDRVEQGQDGIAIKYWVCNVCGNLRVGDNTGSVCPVCRHDGQFYKEVEI
nr:rubrerythrin family protein [Candidatus Sigynarchaeota archaeon]